MFSDIKVDLSWLSLLNLSAAIKVADNHRNVHWFSDVWLLNKKSKKDNYDSILALANVVAHREVGMFKGGCLIFLWCSVC